MKHKLIKRLPLIGALNLDGTLNHNVSYCKECIEYTHVSCPRRDDGALKCHVKKDGTYWKHKRIWINVDNNKLPDVGSLVAYVIDDNNHKKYGVVKKYGKKTVIITTLCHMSLAIYEGVDIQLHLEDKHLKFSTVTGFKYLDHTPDDTIKKKWELQGSKFASQQDFSKLQRYL